MRITAVYGSGKFGAADRAAPADRPLMSGPFRAEMLAVWLICALAMDLVERVAAARGDAASVRLGPAARRRFGIGNSTGLGMAPVLGNHPVPLLDAWITAREMALACVRAVPAAGQAAQAVLRDRLARAGRHASNWHSADPARRARIAAPSDDLARLSAHLAAGALDGLAPWDRVYRWSARSLSIEEREQAAALLLEPHGALVNDLADMVAVDEAAHVRIDVAMPLARVATILQRRYGWALALDLGDRAQAARVWHVSAAKHEPRLGVRHALPGAEREQPLDIARQAAGLRAALDERSGAATVADLLAAAPVHRGIVRRVQTAARHPYAETRHNLCAADLRPVDMPRLRLALFGATRFDPRSDRWVRITMFHNAPFPHELHALPEDDWAFPDTAAPGVAA